MLDGRGNVNPRWRRFFEELTGSGAEDGDVLTSGPDGPEFNAGATTTISQDIEFLEFWRGS